MEENVTDALQSIRRDPELVIAAARRDEVETNLAAVTEEAKAANFSEQAIVNVSFTVIR